MLSHTRTGTSPPGLEYWPPRCANRYQPAPPPAAARQTYDRWPSRPPHESSCGSRRAATSRACSLLALVGGRATGLALGRLRARVVDPNDLERGARVVYTTGRLVRHQRPERSFGSCGYPWPVCGRCAGLYLGAAAGVISFALWRPDRVAADDVSAAEAADPAAANGALWLGEFVMRLDPGTLRPFPSALPAGATGAAWLMAVARGNLVETGEGCARPLSSEPRHEPVLVGLRRVADTGSGAPPGGATRQRPGYSWSCR